ncbi:MAG: hypothetical protein IKP91_03920 [Bacteroidaceae bacterium]|nr:hypothetical protein [Bacteroidaceae bacterium]
MLAQATSVNAKSPMAIAIAIAPTPYSARVNPTCAGGKSPSIQRESTSGSSTSRSIRRSM